MLEVGALTTMTPDWVAALTSTLSRPTPARATTLRFLAAASASASTLVAERTRIASTSAIAGEQLGAVGAVAVPDLEVGAERLDGGGAELFGDEYDGLGHEEVPSGWRGRPRASGRRPSGHCGVPSAILGAAPAAVTGRADDLHPVSPFRLSPVSGRRTETAARVSARCVAPDRAHEPVLDHAHRRHRRPG